MNSAPTFYQNFVPVSHVMLLLFLLVSATSCSTTHQQHQSNRYGILSKQGRHHSDNVHALLSFYKKWQGTPHRLGGTNKNGIDCSGLVQRAYDEIFHVQLPRTTKKQQYAGIPIARDLLTSGDLVFFKNGFWGRHVGIYLENNSFFHSSKRKGVTISSLDDKYWASNYLKSVRIPVQR